MDIEENNRKLIKHEVVEDVPMRINYALLQALIEHRNFWGPPSEADYLRQLSKIKCKTVYP